MGLILATSIAGALSVMLFAMWYLRSKNEHEARIRALGGQQRILAERHGSFGQRVALPAVSGLVDRFISLLPTRLIDRARKQLIVAGDTHSVSQFFSIVLVTSTLLPALYFALAWIATGGELTGLTMLPILVLAGVGAVGPFLVLRRIAKNRQQRIWRSMPNAIDLMTTCVEAGLSLDFALQRVAERYTGPLSDEIHRMLREIALGKTRRDALIDLAERVDVPDLVTFVNSIVQAEALGTRVGGVLRAQAVQMRMRRRQRAERVARQAPVKMVFPLVFFLMPSLFIVTIGPVILNVLKAFSES